MLSISNVSKSYGPRSLYKSGSFQINPGEKVGLVGPNGVGKTSLFRIIIGEEKPDEGTVSFPDKMRLAYFSQNVGEMKGQSALSAVVQSDSNLAKLSKELNLFQKQLEDYESLSEEEMNSLLIRMGDVQTEFEQLGGYDIETRAAEILTGLGISPEEHHKDVGEFSGGWKMRIALAKVLVLEPDLILMDEPTNYLDMETILWLEEWLQNYQGAVFMTTHDRHFMNNIVKKIVEINNSQITSYSGNYDFYLREREVRKEQIIAEYKRQQDKLAKEEEFIAKFKARASHAAQVQSRIKNLEKIDRIELPQEEELVKFEFSKAARGGDDVVIIDDLSKAWGEKKIFDGLNAQIRRQEKIAVVGVNGAGKSTFLKVITGQEAPSRGEARIGPSIKLGYFSQYSLEVLNPENTVLEQLAESLKEASTGYLRNLLAAFLFKGDDVEKKVKYLSGGEKSRLVLAGILSQNNNFLVLDEPTNHLDISSREVLLEALKSFEGTIIFVSHDRSFLHSLSEKVFEVDKGEINIYPGNYEYYLNKKKSLEG
jgi:ATP-binding cassette subfamily F protein 3